MKTSNKLTIAAILLVLVSLVYYDLMLKASYMSGTYKDQFRDFVALNFKDFKSINLGSCTASNIIVEQGPFSVRIEPTADQFVKVSQRDQTLHIETAFPGNYQNSRAEYVLIISCPSLASIAVDSRYMSGDQLVIDTIASADFKWRPSIIRGFTLDSLLITEKHAGSVILQNNKIKGLKAVIGLEEGSGSNMVILKNNEFQDADLHILNKSQLFLHEASIPNLKYQLADSAKLIITGALKKQIIKK
ncbi:hypothetical protein [Mucilaginibacter xinganensis]|uniref:Uncharacterized protein n=1 Tax=Mucilaginibacter xinganensis TaxID=1234841 RepID=A0A223NWJ2_9SPHI|nr:hypothetical protein [Mucilaginibacter xinganensis]ASU34074.1 hypothetical protein MuYL_2184 [Mucilaginibacter xinganensis]